jgi:hypothetical protein
LLQSNLYIALNAISVGRLVLLDSDVPAITMEMAVWREF